MLRCFVLLEVSITLDRLFYTTTSYTTVVFVDSKSYTHICSFDFIIDGRGVRCSSVVRAFAHGAMGRRIDPS